MSVVLCKESKLTCTVPGNVLGQSCAGLHWAAVGTGSGQEAAPPQLRRGPAAQRRPFINTTLKTGKFLKDLSNITPGCPEPSLLVRNSY